jgi:hypothetical protein
MADESREITIRIGVKLTDAEVEAIDPKNIGHLQAQPPKSGVEGQWSYTCMCRCPLCGCTNYGRSAMDYRYYTCNCCGGVFRA